MTIVLGLTGAALAFVAWCTVDSGGLKFGSAAIASVVCFVLCIGGTAQTSSPSNDECNRFSSFATDC